VDLVALKQRPDAVTVSRARWNMQQHITAAQRLVEGRQGRLVVTEPLKPRTTRPRSPW
jgi:hypothetical protein